MVQNVFTLTHLLDGVKADVMHDFSYSISPLTDAGWKVKEISTTTYVHGGEPFLAVTILAEKSE